MKETENTVAFLRRLPGFYRATSFAALFVLLFVSNRRQNLSLNEFQVFYLVFLFFGVILYFVLQKHKKILSVILGIEYFAVLFFAYVEPHFLIMELIWAPGIITALTFILPRRAVPVLVPAVGIAGFPVFSYGCIYNTAVTIGGLVLPYVFIAMLYNVPVTLLALLLNRLSCRMEEAEKHYATLKIENTRLNEINHVTAQRIFSLQNDTTQKERNRLSKEIHDTAGYVFINLIMMLQAAAAILHKDIDKADKLICDARDYAERGINEIRHLLRDIRNYRSISLSLQNELHDVGQSFQKATGVEVNIEYGMWPKTYSKNVDSFFIAFMQEALTNALKHGHADKISVICWEDKTHTGMTITDNGGGARVPIKKGIGITAMEDTAAQFEGSINISSGLDGFRISAALSAPA